MNDWKVSVRDVKWWFARAAAVPSPQLLLHLHGRKQTRRALQERSQRARRISNVLTELLSKLCVCRRRLVLLQLLLSAGWSSKLNDDAGQMAVTARRNRSKTRRAGASRVRNAPKVAGDNGKERSR